MDLNESGNAGLVETLLESSLDSVDTAETLVIDTATRMGFEEDDLHKLGMAVRESMVNAVVHGNKYNANKRVHFKVESTAERLTVVIGDEGAGFDMTRIPDPLAEENLLRQSGRGILLIQAFVDEFHVARRKPSGTEVTLVKYRAK